jgi:hypothetical protein
MNHPVELLTDRQGVYGIGVAKEAEIARPPGNLLLRPDRLNERWAGGGAIYQMITGGFRFGMFNHTLEEQLRKLVHHDLLCRAGLPWPPTGVPGGKDQYWSMDKAQQNRNRQIYHGLRLRSLSVINKIIGSALEKAAVPEAVKQARRFRFCYRQSIYEIGATSLRGLQLIETFPALMLSIVRSNSQPEQREAMALVERGAPLKKIADLMCVPMALQKVKPGATDLALKAIEICARDERLFHAQLPNSLPRMKTWLKAVIFASDLGPEFVEWTAKHAFEISENYTEIRSFLQDTEDWVRACLGPSVPTDDDLFSPDCHPAHRDVRGEEFVTRHFSPNMSLRTVMRLSGTWHEAVANNMDGPSYLFPEPWHNAGMVGDYEILPITNNADLYREGHAMHHCVGTYGDRVRCGETYIYSIRKHGDRIATAQVIKHGERASLDQLRGPCNSQVPKEVEGVVQKWLRSQKEFRFTTIDNQEIPF